MMINKLALAVLCFGASMLRKNKSTEVLDFRTSIQRRGISIYQLYQPIIDGEQSVRKIRDYIG